jgi:hypothetical protein
VLHQWILRFLFGAVAFPILMCLLFGLGYLLSALEDEPGALVVARINLGLAVLWVFNVLLLIIALAFASLGDRTVRTVETTEEIIPGPADEER